MNEPRLLEILASPVTHRPLHLDGGELRAGDERFSLSNGTPIMLSPQNMRFAHEDCDELHRASEVWRRKPILRRVYHSWYDRIIAAIPRGGVGIEVSGGSGNFKEYFPGVYNSDIRLTPFVDFVCSATELSIRSECLDYVVVIDGIHHYPQVFRFFREARRVLKSGGRLIFCEPYLSPIAGLVRAGGHHEDIDWDTYDVKEKALEANLAIPTKLFTREPDVFRRECEGLVIREIRLLEQLVYPLTGGFNHRSLLPTSMYPAARLVEKLLPPKLFSFKIFGIIEKVD